MTDRVCRAAFPTVLALLLGAGTVLRAVSLSVTPAPGSREAALVTQVVELCRTGLLGPLQLGRLPVNLVSLATPQLAAITAGSGAWGRVPTALGAVRESGIPLWLGVAVLTAVLARRLGVGRTGTLGAVAVLALSPAAVSASRVVSPENVAALWALGALVLTTRRSAGPDVPSARPTSAPLSARSTSEPLSVRPTSGATPDRTSAPWRALATDLAAVGCLSVAVLSAPVALALLPTVLMATARHGDGRRVALVAGAVLLSIGAGAAALLTATAPGGLANAVPGLRDGRLDGPWLGADLGTLVLAVAAASVAFRHPLSRPLALGVTLVPALSAIFGAAAAPLTVPLVAVLVPGLAAAVLGRLTERCAADRTVAAAILVGACALLWAPGYARLPAALHPPATAQAATWLRTHLAPGRPVLTDARTRVALVAGTDAWNQVHTLTACRQGTGPFAAGTRCTRDGLWVVDPAARSGLPHHTTLLAAFGTNHTGRVEIREARPGHRP